MLNTLRILCLAMLCLVFGSRSANAWQDDPKFSARQIEFFEAKVRPLLAKRCFECHSEKAESPKGGLRLDRRETAIKGGDNGPAIVAGKPDESLLIESVRWESFEMPPSGKLAESEIAILQKWIELGAPWPKVRDKANSTEQKSPSYDWKKLQRERWAFRPVVRPAIPVIKNHSWPRNEIDRFILAKLEASGLQPSPPADLRILARRIYYDLIGLPPTPEEVQQFLVAGKSDRQRAVKELVDRLLESPHYGERWGRHWLDVARYSDGHGGFSNNAALPQAWRYRDWVVNAFNRDLPYHEFVKLQIAGDVVDKQNKYHVATGFFALGPTYVSDGGDPDSVAQSKSETLDDRVDTLTRGLLGLTVSCARCHDHKFDPIPQIDYYSLAGIFNNSGVRMAPAAPPEQVKLFDEHQAKINRKQQQIKQSQNRLKKQKRPPNAYEKYLHETWQSELAELKKTLPRKYDQVHALAESGKNDMKVAIRGNLRKPGENAPRRFLRILSGPERQKFDQGSGRQQLADAITDDKNPLFARVIVNRVWMHHFGAALVRTPSNFGELGETPTHPKLLDWLASHLVASGWSMKTLHRTIINSSAYQMSSRYNSAAFEVDGDNRLIWRMNPRRLGAESWRDTLLSVTGELDRKLGGPPTEDIHSKRRTLYFKVSRNGDRFASDEFLRLFDFPLMRATVAKRPTSIIPQQFLFLMNSRFMLDRARALAQTLENAAQDPAARIQFAYRQLYGRDPTSREQKLGLEFIRQAELLQKERMAEQRAKALAANQVKKDLMIADFESADYGQWKTTGEAFGKGPANGTLGGQMQVSGFLGKRLVNSFFNGDKTTGKLTSPQIEIKRNHIHFLVGGGKFPGVTCINLIVDGKVVLTATGPNDQPGGSELLSWTSWDVKPYLNKQATIEIVDQHTGGWGHINVDHIVQSDRRQNPKARQTGKQKAKSQPVPSPWQQYAQVLLSSNELMYVR